FLPAANYPPDGSVFLTCLFHGTLREIFHEPGCGIVGSRPTVICDRGGAWRETASLLLLSRVGAVIGGCSALNRAGPCEFSNFGGNIASIFLLEEGTTILDVQV